jgi:hypothetical protein
MNPELKLKIQNQFKALPDALQAYILSDEASRGIDKVCKETGYSAEKIKVLETEIMTILIGLILPNEFVGNLSKDLGISQTEATQLAKKIDAHVLSPVREILKTMQDLQTMTDLTAPETKPSTPHPTPKPAPKMEISTIPKIETPKFQAPQHPQQSGPIPNLRTMPRDVARLKLAESVRLPKEEISVRYKSEESQHSAPKKTGLPTEEKQQGAGDPYRETPQ